MFKPIKEILDVLKVILEELKILNEHQEEIEEMLDTAEKERQRGF